MSILTPEGFPAPPGKINYWGLPLHGLCRAGQLQLPNGITVPYPQPTGGHTCVVKNPRRAALPANPRPLAQYDAAQGFSWLTFLILAGEHKEVAGQAIGATSWIWVDARDRSWLMQLSEVSGNYRITIKRRFGLFGQDYLSMLSNVVIYEGKLGEDRTEYLSATDLSQNWDGTSVMLNFRLAPIMSYDKKLPTLLRVVEVNLSGAVTNIYGGGVRTSHRHEIANAEVSSVEDFSYDTGDKTPAYCGLHVASREVIPSNEGNSTCGPGAFEIGAWTSSGTMSSNVVSNSTQRDYGYSHIAIIHHKVFYSHSNEKCVLRTHIANRGSTSITADCNAQLSASYSTTKSVADIGGGCSDYAQYQKTSTVSGTAHGVTTTLTKSQTTRALQINGVPLVTFAASEEFLSVSERNAEESGSSLLTWVEPAGAPNDPIETRVMELIGKPLNDPLVVQNETALLNSSTTTMADFDGEQNGLPDSDYVGYFYDRVGGAVQYANRIFGYRLGDGSLTVDNHAYEGVYGLIADLDKIMSGRLQGETLTATLDPVTGHCEADFAQAKICYI